MDQTHANQSLGQLKNAPLCYVLGQIVFNRVPKMGTLWEDLHQRIFAQYPESIIENEKIFRLETEGAALASEMRWHLLSRDRRQGVLLTANMLILHTTRYKTSSIFFDDLGFLLEQLIEVLPQDVPTKRLGLRYVDLLLPHPNLTVGQQVVSHLDMHNLESIGCNAQRFERVSKYTTDCKGDLKIRAVQSTNADILPPDVFPNILEPAPVLSVKKDPDSIVGLLDFDHFITMDEPLNAGTIVGKFKALQKTSSNAFKAVTTEDAKAIWKGE